MKSLTVGEFKARLSELLEQVQEGETVEVLYGKKRKPVARLVPVNGKKPKKKRKLGILEGKAKVIFADDFKMTEEEFINLR
jgi:prevent-host-death family protein